MNKNPNNLIKILVIVLSLNGILCGCGGSSYEGSSEPRSNVEPVANPDLLTVDEDSFIELLPQILANDTDEDGDNLSPTFLTSPTNGAISTLKGKYKYIPTVNFNGPDQIVYEVSDGYGGTSSATIFLNILPVNDFPIVVDDVFQMTEDTTSSFDVLVNDSDIDGDNLRLLNVSLVQNGIASIDSVLNTVRVTPFADSVESVSFAYTATDGNGGYDIGSVIVTVNSVNDTPVASDDTANTQIDVPVTIPVLQNDFDVDIGDSISLEGINSITGGSAVIQNDSIIVTPDVSSYQSISLEYEISDSKNARSTASVNISIDCDTYERLEIEFVCIHAGSFLMGSPTTEPLRDSDEGPLTPVTITKDFYLSKYEITKADWERVWNAANLIIAQDDPIWPVPQIVPISDDHPAIGVSWDDINEVNGFLDDINLLVGCDTSSLSTDRMRYDPSIVPSGCFRLPTEAEWEYAARAETNTRYSFGDDETQLNLYALYDPDPNDLFNAGSANPVGQFLPNANGLYDMHGNVREWVFDQYSNSTYTGIAQSDPIGVSSSLNRVLRGGSYINTSEKLRSANRMNRDLNDRADTNGFRLVFVR